MSDVRVSFDQALEGFRKFLRDQGWSDDLLWLSRDRITGHRRKFWVLRPEDLRDPRSTKDFYEAVRRTESSIRIDALCRIGERTLAYAEDIGGESRLLNYGIHTGAIHVQPVTHRLQFMLVAAGNSLRGVSPFLRRTGMTPDAEQVSGGNGGQRR